ncbi:MAG: helicase-related protein [Jatrophihabitantaceae bacterium]
MTAAQRPDVEAVLSQLKDFQRATVEHVHRRLWLDDDPARRFLVADEVGLGKTMIAKGVIAKTLDHLWDNSEVERIDLVYICSNAQIARQNIARLNIPGEDLNHADRLTLLARNVRQLRERKVNVVSFTPGTSFTIGDRSGRVEERALIFALLRKVWGGRAVSSAAWKKFFMDNASEARLDRALAQVGPAYVDEQIAIALANEIESARFGDSPDTLGSALEQCVSEFRYLRKGASVSPEVRRTRARLIGQMRSVVAGAALQSLRPSLVILDEFQRFKTLLDPNEATAQLAHVMFAQQNTRVLMLSATPYKMYTLPNEPEGENHYQDFESTIDFLAGTATAQAVSADLATMRRGILNLDSRPLAEAARDRVQTTLGRYLSRTERLSLTKDQDGMLREQPTTIRLTAADVRAYRTGQAVSDAIGGDETLEYWKSTPYLLNLMDDYKLKRRFSEAIAAPSPELVSALDGGDGLLDWATIEAYQRLDPGNAKMRALSEDVIDRGAWKLAWLPPALSYYSLSGDYSRKELASFTKRLVFSAWNVVPKAIATMLSYDAERATAIRSDPERRYGTAPRPLLTFSRSEGRLGGMPLLAILYPCVTLAQLGDPLELARTMGELPAPQLRMQGMLRDRVEEALAALPPGRSDGPEDQSWYWAAPFLLDAPLGANQTAFIDMMISWGNAGDDDVASAQAEHIQQAAAVNAADLGRRPQDLVQVLTLMALASPGITALRALKRVAPTTPLTDPELRFGATFVSWALRALFNQSHIADIVRYGSKEDVYWRSVLNHCSHGCLQAVLDEYVHILVDSTGQQDKADLARTMVVARTIAKAMGLRATRNAVDDIRVASGAVTTERKSLAVHFAVRFGRDASDTEKVQDREQSVRDSFNSPFWPFVLASTSVGQEGLDFHLYSHAVVHWNLPGNPVDLEQREGRVHRYKNHAIRKNVASSYGRSVLDSTDPDPWATLFLAAQDARPAGANDLVPFWIFSPPGGAVIERYVPALPLSLETARYRRLQRTVGAYRMVLGQPRQEDLVLYAAGSEGSLDWLRIDLAPPAVAVAAPAVASPEVLATTCTAPIT